MAKIPVITSYIKGQSNKQNKSNHGLATSGEWQRWRQKKSLVRWGKKRLREAWNYELGTVGPGSPHVDDDNNNCIVWCLETYYNKCLYSIGAAKFKSIRINAKFDYGLTKIF